MKRVEALAVDGCSLAGGGVETLACPRVALTWVRHQASTRQLPLSPVHLNTNNMAEHQNGDTRSQPAGSGDADLAQVCGF